MKKIVLYEPAMCCPTGLCGVSPNPDLLRISAAADTLAKKGFPIERYNLSSAPQEFVTNEIVRLTLETEGTEALPLTSVDGVIVKKGAYPSNKELAVFLELPQSEWADQTAGGCGCSDGCC